MSTYYEILEVSETASTDLIKQRFQQLILLVKHLSRKKLNMHRLTCPLFCLLEPSR